MKLQLGLNLMFAGLLAASSHAQVLHYDFNDPENGTSTVSIGSNTATANFQLNGVATNLHGAAGSGLTGGSWDYAFDNTPSAGMGSVPGTNGGVGIIAGGADVFDGATSFTLTGWFKSDTVIDNAARLFEASGTGALLRLYSSGAGRLRLELDTPSSVGEIGVTSTASYGATDAWTFFAVTYDESLSRVSFYLGTTGSAVTEVNRQTLNGGVLGDFSGALQIGGAGSVRPYDGLMDNFRVFAATSGSSGALTGMQLEALRYGDITAVPEPSSVVLIFGAGILYFLYFLKRSRRSGRQA